MRRSLAVVALSLFAIGSAAAAVKGEAVEYKSGGTTFKGYLAYDAAAKGKRPGVLVVHEWWGHNEHARAAARKLAQAGYVALAVDMYGGGKTADHPKDAGAFSGEVRKNMALMKERFGAARAFLAKQASVDTARVAAVGYCFGGSVALEMARQGEDLRAVAAFHAGLATESPAKKGKFKPQVLVLTGAADPMIDAAQVAAFEAEMKAAGVKYKVVSYPGAKHGFTNPDATAKGKQFNIPLAYDADADKKSWAEATAFLRSALQ